MKPNELRQLDPSSIERLILEQKEKLRDLQFKAGQGKLSNIREIRVVKKLIARIITMQNDGAWEKSNA